MVGKSVVGILSVGRQPAPSNLPTLPKESCPVTVPAYNVQVYNIQVCCLPINCTIYSLDFEVKCKAKYILHEKIKTHSKSIY